MVVCIVDPSSTFRRRVRNAISNSSYTYCEVGSGKHLLTRLVRDEPPDIIILTHELGDMFGVEAVSAIRGMDDYSKTPILLMAPTATHEEVLDAVERGVDSYIILPFDEAALAHKVRRAAKKVRATERVRRRNGYTSREIL